MRRWGARASLAAFALAVPTALVAAQRPPSSLADERDLLGPLANGGAREATVADADKGLASNERLERMRSCLGIAKRRIAERAEETEASVSSLMAQAEQASVTSGQAVEMTEDQAISQLIFGMVMSCYQAIDKATVEIGRRGASPSEDVQERLFELAAKPPRPTRKQYQLLTQVMQEARTAEGGPETVGLNAGVGEIGIVGSSMSTGARVLYVLLVFGALIGGGAWALRWTFGSKGAREFDVKRQRQVERAEARLDKLERKKAR